MLTPVDPRMNKCPKTMNILPHASNTPDYTPLLMIARFTGKLGLLDSVGLN